MTYHSNSSKKQEECIMCGDYYTPCNDTMCCSKKCYQAYKEAMDCVHDEEEGYTLLELLYAIVSITFGMYMLILLIWVCVTVIAPMMISMTQDILHWIKS